MIPFFLINNYFLTAATIYFILEDLYADMFPPGSLSLFQKFKPPRIYRVFNSDRLNCRRALFFHEH